MTKSTRPSLADAMQRVSRPQQDQPAAAAEERVKLTIRLPPATHKALRHFAIVRGRSVDSIVNGWILAGLAEED